MFIVKTQSENLARERGKREPKSSKSNILMPNVHFLIQKVFIATHYSLYVLGRVSDTITCLKFTKLNIGFGRIILTKNVLL